MSNLTLGSLFDGSGGFSLAGMMAGITPIWASEIEPFPIRVTTKRIPHMKHYGDISKMNGGKIEPVDIITFGSPCQNLSLAGKREGLNGEKSSMFFEAIRVIKEMRENTNGEYPRWIVWENVPGAMSSSKGQDFRTVLEEICKIKDETVHIPMPEKKWTTAGEIVGNDYSVAYRILDAQYFGVPQRRRRIFLVADFAGRSAPQILFEQNRLPGYSASSGGQRQGTAASAPGCSDPPGGTGPIGFDGYNGDLTGEKAATLGVNCGMSTGRNGVLTAFAANQRDEVRDLHDVAAALTAQPGMKQQTFVAGITAKGNGDCFLSEERHTALSGGGGMPGQGYPAIFTAAFSAGAGASAGSIGYGEEVSPTLKGTASGNCMPSILCLNDQGGSAIACSENVAGTLRAQEHGHQPLVFENHGIDARYTGPHSVAPTMSARYGTGGNNVPLVAEPDTIFCITGNAIDRQPMNGGNGIGYQQGIAYTLTATDHHAVFSRQRVDVFKSNEVVSTQSARQHKDATDLVVDMDEPDNSASAPRGASVLLIRRLTPLECERLQGFPDGWTDIEGASDSARYKALGNSVAIPCVDYVLQGIAWATTAQIA